MDHSARVHSRHLNPESPPPLSSGDKLGTESLYVVPTVLTHRASLASLLGSLSSLSEKGGNVRSQKEGRTPGQLAF